MMNNPESVDISLLILQLEESKKELAEEKQTRIIEQQQREKERIAVESLIRMRAAGGLDWDDSKLVDEITVGVLTHGKHPAECVQAYLSDCSPPYQARLPTSSAATADSAD